MHIVSKKKLREYWQEHADAEIPLREWIKVVENGEWSDTSDVRQTFGSADFHKEFVIFNIGGNNYRILAKIEYSPHYIVFIKAVLTHVEYDKHKDWCGCGKKGKSR